MHHGHGRIALDRCIYLSVWLPPSLLPSLFPSLLPSLLPSVLASLALSLPPSLSSSFSCISCAQHDALQGQAPIPARFWVQLQDKTISLSLSLALRLLPWGLQNPKALLGLGPDPGHGSVNCDSQEGRSIMHMQMEQRLKVEGPHNPPHIFPYVPSSNEHPPFSTGR